MPKFAGHQVLLDRNDGKSEAVAIALLAEGDVEVTGVLIRTVAYAPCIDRDSAHAGIDMLRILDDLEIYGKRIAALWKHMAAEDLTNFVVILRAAGMGILPHATLNRAIANKGDTEAGIKFPETIPYLVSHIQERRFNFTRPKESMRL